jgi:Arc/MetJ-type ribon-helix-helix transcriptional regulator
MEMTDDQERKNVSISGRLYRQIEERVAASEFTSVDEYVNFILEEVMNEAEEEDVQLSSEDEDREVKKRLKDLGYLD